MSFSPRMATEKSSISQHLWDKQMTAAFLLLGYGLKLQTRFKNKKKRKVQSHMQHKLRIRLLNWKKIILVPVGVEKGTLLSCVNDIAAAAQHTVASHLAKRTLRAILFCKEKGLLPPSSPSLVSVCWDRLQPLPRHLQPHCNKWMEEMLSNEFYYLPRCQKFILKS